MLSNLFLLFFKINLLTQSGPASYGLTEKLTVPSMLSQERFNRIVAISAGIPGSDAVQMAWQVGFEVAKLPGALVSVLGALMPCIFLVVAATALTRLLPQGTMNNFFAGIKPALFFFLLIYAAQLITPVSGVFQWKFIAIFIMTAFLYTKNVNPFIIIITSGIIGLI